MNRRGCEWQCDVPAWTCQWWLVVTLPLAALGVAGAGACEANPLLLVCRSRCQRRHSSACSPPTARRLPLAARLQMAINPPLVPGGVPMGITGERFCVQRGSIKAVRIAAPPPPRRTRQCGHSLRRCPPAGHGGPGLQAEGVRPALLDDSAHLLRAGRACRRHRRFALAAAPRAAPQSPRALATRGAIAHIDGSCSARAAVDLPLQGISDEDFKQPIFGANYLCGTVAPVPGRGLGGPTRFKLYFYAGGCKVRRRELVIARLATLPLEPTPCHAAAVAPACTATCPLTVTRVSQTFLDFFFAIMERYKAADAASRRAFFASAAAVSSFIRDRQAFVDPSDPTVVFVVQPAAVETAGYAPAGAGGLATAPGAPAPGSSGGGMAASWATAPPPAAAPAPASSPMVPLAPVLPGYAVAGAGFAAASAPPSSYGMTPGAVYGAPPGAMYGAPPGAGYGAPPAGYGTPPPPHGHAATSAVAAAGYTAMLPRF